MKADTQSQDLLSQDPAEECDSEEEDAVVEEEDDSCCEITPSLLALQLAEYPVIDKIGGYEFYRKVLKSPKYVVAPMVDMSFLAFRALCRRYAAELCYTPMMHSKTFAHDATYRKKFFSTCPEDRPLVIQFCGNDPLILLKATKLAENQCDAIDINLGCPQNIARKGRYGAYLMHHPETVAKIVNTLHKHIKVPIFCKMRVFRDLDETIKFAKMLEEAGCQLLTVHGRTKEQKGHQQGLANWDYIRRIKEELSIPVIANGNIQKFEDVQQCLEATKCDGVMSAETILENPALFSGKIVSQFDISHEYLDICEKLHPTRFKYIRTHLLQMLKPSLEKYSDVRDIFGRARTIPQARAVIEKLREKELTNAPIVMHNVQLREVRKARKINKTEDSWDSSLFNEPE